MSQAYKVTSLSECLSIVATECRVDRLFQEDPGVLALLWFGRDPDSPWHVFANFLRIFIAIPLAPFYVVWAYLAAPWRQAIKAAVHWKVEWPHVPDAIILEPPSTGSGKVGSGTTVNGEYAVTNNKPRWLLEVHFEGTTVSSKKQVPYDGGHPDESALSPEGFALRKAIQEHGYTAISYPMKSATHMFLNEARQQLDPSPNPGRELSLDDRQCIAHLVLKCFAEARASIPGMADGVEYIWLDEFCLSDARSSGSTEQDKVEIDRQRKLELGQIADIFRSARRVVVFCHEPRCGHANAQCAWGKRLFTLGEIMYTEEVYQMTRRPGPDGGLVSSITILPGYEFRGTMQAQAAKEKQWHLYNIMQHSTNSGSVNWQSAIHALVVEAIRQDEADGFHLHNMLGKALNGLLPRRSKSEDLEGVDGWGDLAWLLELNQGFYNAAALAAVCQLADPWVEKYRWWGKPIKPEEGRERLEPLSTAIPAKFRDEIGGSLQPVLSIIGPKSVKVRNVLRRDGSALFRHPDMRILKTYAVRIAAMCLIFMPLLVLKPKVGGALLWIVATSFTTLELLVGTIYVKKDGWVVYRDDHFPDGDPIHLLKERDFSYKSTIEWGDRQLIPRWDVSLEKTSNGAAHVPRPFRVTLVDLRSGVYTKAMVTRMPNCMVVLAVHGGGITCMLLEREEKTLGATISTKVGMVNIPPFVLNQADNSGTVYVGGDALCMRPVNIPSNSPSSTEGGDLHASHTPSQSRRSESSKPLHATNMGSPPSSSTPGIVSSSWPSISPRYSSSEMTQLPSGGPVGTAFPAHKRAHVSAISETPTKQSISYENRTASRDDLDFHRMVEHGPGQV